MILLTRLYKLLSVLDIIIECLINVIAWKMNNFLLLNLGRHLKNETPLLIHPNVFCASYAQEAEKRITAASDELIAPGIVQFI